MGEPRRFGLPAISALLLAATLAPPALADRIDGDWCFPDGRRFSIRGPAIVTPSGTSTTGDYSRHHFDYVVPASDPDAGKTVDMRLVNENTVYLWLGGVASETEAPPQVWHRCLPEVSLAAPTVLQRSVGSPPVEHSPFGPSSAAWVD
jgi:hypothetical protein